MTSKVLFILKRREDYLDHPSYSSNIGLSTGLINSATFVNNMLLANNIESKIVVVTDNNDIHREVTIFKPTHVVIEALWVVPSKFEVLCKLHPTINWIVRFHSQTPFIANEGIAMEWLFEYIKYPNVYLGINASEFFSDVKIMLTALGLNDEEVTERLIFLPNYYPIPEMVPTPKSHPNRNYVNVGCFGAIRPLKNQLTQAVAALAFAKKINKVLHFHINVSRTEMKGDSILKNIQMLFDKIGENDHKLIVHAWAPHSEFIEVVQSMDIGMQVSFTETFNIVAADMITAGVPFVVSEEVTWAKDGTADPTRTDDIIGALVHAYKYPRTNVIANLHGLQQYVHESERRWVSYFQ